MAESLLTFFIIISASFIFFIKEAMISSFGAFVGSLLVSEGLCNEEECVICLCKIRRGRETDALRCRHVFHKQCLDGWVKKSKGKNCPLCRDSLIDGGSSATKNGEEEDGGLSISNNIIIISPFRESRSRDLCWIR
ncbi:putative E3 ubiquitin-protein ligase RHA2B [Dendrobium catenatum]|uniref:Putative E3 ubiquitin-protein ligase RHA2B n=1 Tax=Dendrobium catenatum TaxID=906689 RepID=A0A2I0X2X8_9ASPA|nr:putative E3 ubiquitin-protein ligase RHA2B [Dendrobium catenatum]